MKRIISCFAITILLLSIAHSAIAESHTLHIWFPVLNERHNYAAAKTMEKYPNLEIIYHSEGEATSDGDLWVGSPAFTNRLFSRDPDIDLVTFDMAMSGREMLLSGIFEDIGHYPDIVKWESAMLDITDLYKLGDALFGLPQFHSLHIWYGNKALFEKLGLPLPTEDWTWEDFYTLALQVNTFNQQNSTDYKLIYEANATPYMLKQYVLSGIDHINRTHTLRDTRFKELLNMWIELCDLGVYQLFSDQPEAGQKIILDDTLIVVRQQSFGTSGILGADPYQMQAEKDLPYAFIIPPTEESLKPGIVDTAGIALARFSDAKEEAVYYLSCYLDPTASQTQMNIENAINDLLYNAGPLYKQEPFLVSYQTDESSPFSAGVDYWIYMAENAAADMRDEMTSVAFINGQNGGGFFDLRQGAITLDQYIENCCRIADQYLGE